ncbi:MAG: hypothetical protein IPF50_12190, partial [Proteobacteria bacterium]|nr:hypothetical protein [Pseudomonadota bacterium]
MLTLAAIFLNAPTSIGEILRNHPMAVPFLEQRYVDMTKQFYQVDIHQLPGRVMCSDFESLVRLVAISPRYFTAGPFFAFAPEIEAGRLRVFDTHLPFSHLVALHTNADAFPIPAVAKVLDIIREAFGTVFARDPAGAEVTPGCRGKLYPNASVLAEGHHLGFVALVAFRFVPELNGANAALAAVEVDHSRLGAGSKVFLDVELFRRAIVVGHDDLAHGERCV